MAEIKLLDSRFIKINAERNLNFNEKVEINTSIKIKNIEKIKESKEAIKIEYAFDINYSNLGKILIEGILFLSLDPKQIKELFKSQKEKLFNTPEHIIITNLIIQRASIKALEIEEEMGLPIHIKLPIIGAQKI